jgi:hypothetical protein
MKKNPKNIKEFNALIRKYETITLEQIEDSWNEMSYPDGGDVAEDLTGFGSLSNCTLCKGAGVKEKEDCWKCVYYRNRKETFLFFCNTGKNQKTYEAIENAYTPEDLLKAFHKRAKHMRKTYPQYIK